MPRILAVGLDHGDDFAAEGVSIEKLGLCRAEIDHARAAFPLYEYDAIIINPQSFSHFLFGAPTEHSDNIEGELRALKNQRDAFDIDSLFDPEERRTEMVAAIERGTTVVWCLSPSRRQNMFGFRETWMGYCAPPVAAAVKRAQCAVRKGREIGKVEDGWPFHRLLAELTKTSWNVALAGPDANIKSLVFAPDGQSLGGWFEKGEYKGWLTTPPTSREVARALIADTVSIVDGSPVEERYHGLFLSHTSADKPFVRRVSEDLRARGVPVWLDEAEIQIGDSLTGKIAEGLKKSRFIAVFLSARSIDSAWVQKELDLAMNAEIQRKEVVVLPLMIEKCDLPPFLVGKLYGDFTTAENYADTLERLLRRLQK